MPKTTCCWKMNFLDFTRYSDYVLRRSRQFHKHLGLCEVSLEFCASKLLKSAAFWLSYSTSNRRTFFLRHRLQFLSSIANSQYYVDAACCYRPSSVVCRSVCLSVGLSICHTSESCKNGWTDRDAVWDVDSGGAVHWRHLANTILNSPGAATMRPPACCPIALTTCFTGHKSRPVLGAPAPLTNYLILL